MSHVDEAILTRMCEAFPPPTHLRGRPQAIERTLKTYRAALERFERPVLERAWQRVAQEHRFWSWPILAEVVKAAESCQREDTPGDEWVERATALEDAYVRRFMKTHQAAVRAREGGYEGELKAYVRECAHVQAQYIVGRKDVNYVSGVLFPERDRDREAEDEWFERAKAQADKGGIQVRVPQDMIEKWKAAAERGRAR